MNIFHKVAAEGLTRNRTRTLVTVVGVALSAAMFTAVTTFAVSLQSYMMNGAIAKCGFPGRVDSVCRGTAGG